VYDVDKVFASLFDLSISVWGDGYVF
jgi:hypothetical protein